MKPKSNDDSKIELGYPSESDTNQSRKVGMFKASSNFDQFNEMNPFVGMESNPCGGQPTASKER